MNGYDWLTVIVVGVLLYKCCIFLLRRYTKFGKEEYQRLRLLERNDLWREERATDLEIINQFRDADISRSIDNFQEFCRWRDKELKEAFTHQFYMGIWLGALPIALYFFYNPFESFESLIGNPFLVFYLVVLGSLMLTVGFSTNIQDNFKCRRTQGYALLITGFIVCCFIAGSI